VHDVVTLGCTYTDTDFPFLLPCAHVPLFFSIPFLCLFPSPRGISIHPDLRLGGVPASATTGNAGDRIACCIIDWCVFAE